MISVAGGYTQEVCNTIRDIDRAAWEQLCPVETDLFMNPGLLGAVEASMSADASFWYVLYRDSLDQPVAAAAISSYVIDSTVLAVGFGAKVAKIVGSVIPSLTRMKILFLGMPFSAGQSHVRFSPGADRGLVVKLLCELLESTAKESKSEMIVAKEFRESELGWAAGMEEHGYRRADSLPMNLMETDHESLDASLAQVKSRRRRDIQRVRRRFHEGNLTQVWCRGEEAAGRFDRRAHQLYENVLFRSQTRSEYLPREFFVELARQLPDNAEFFYCYDGDLLVFFECCLFSESMYYPMYGGMDYDRSPSENLYSNLLFEGVDRGLQSGRPQLWVGANADDLKHRKVGTFQEPRYLFVRGGWWLAKLILKPAFNMFFPKHEVLYPREQPFQRTKAA